VKSSPGRPRAPERTARFQQRSEPVNSQPSSLFCNRGRCAQSLGIRHLIRRAARSTSWAQRLNTGWGAPWQVRVSGNPPTDQYGHPHGLPKPARVASFGNGLDPKPSGDVNWSVETAQLSKFGAALARANEANGSWRQKLEYVQKLFTDGKTADEAGYEPSRYARLFACGLMRTRRPSASCLMEVGRQVHTHKSQDGGPGHYLHIPSFPSHRPGLPLSTTSFDDVCCESLTVRRSWTRVRLDEIAQN
jgi:hypothetical protein